jgi:hypothetical protein
VGLPSGDDEIFRLLLLQDQPHRLQAYKHAGISSAFIF